MIKSIRYTLLVMLFCFVALAKPVELDKAKQVATNFLKTNAKSNSIASAEDFNITAFPSSQDTKIYIFEKKSGIGFILVSADDAAMPVLAYSNNTKFVNNESSNVYNWISDYSAQITYAVNKNEDNAALKSVWQNAISGNVKSNKIATASSVEPMLKTNWDQVGYYNAKCPSNGSGKAVTGCVATALAQVLKYWSYPKKGTGSYSFNHPVYGTLSANFGTTTYDWAKMPNMVTSPNDAVATLMYHLGVAVDMNYSPQSSGSQGGILAGPALIKYFTYPSDVRFLARDSYKTNWLTMLKTEIEEGRPVYYEGVGQAGGHAFVFDGYDENNYFHINWGWSGNSDGYFLIDALSPAALGTGGGGGGFNYNQGAMFGMAAPVVLSTGMSTISLNSLSSVTPSSIDYGKSFTVTGKVQNTSSNLFTGKIFGVVTKLDGTYIASIDTLKTSLNSFSTANYSFTSKGLSSLVPGSYYVTIYAQTNTGNLTVVNNGSYNNKVLLNVTGKAESIKLSQAIGVYQSNVNVTQTTVDDLKSTGIKFNVNNAGLNEFQGIIKFSLYSLNGDFVRDIGTYNASLAAAASFPLTSQVTISTGLNVIPGDYLIKALYKSNADTEFTVVDKGSFQNPIQIKVGLNADTYEPNDSLYSSKRVVPVIDTVSQIGLLKVSNLSFHQSTDVDYFILSVPNTCEFNLKVYLIDKNNSTTLSRVDAGFTYFLNDKESAKIHADTAKINIPKSADATDLFIKVSPMVAGSLGTYELKVEFEGVLINGIESDNLENKVTLSPNPTDGFLNFNSDKVNKVEIFDSKGTLVKSINTLGSKQLNLNGLANDKYFLKLYLNDTESSIQMNSIIINK